MTYDSSKFVQDCLRTEAPVTPEVQERMTRCGRLLHSAMGKATEIGEFTDELKRHIFYGKPLDLVNLGEEIADGWWYDAIACDVMGLKDFFSLQEKVINKLKKRFPEKFAEYEAMNRDLEAERKELERSTSFVPEPLTNDDEENDRLVASKKLGIGNPLGGGTAGRVDMEPGRRVVEKIQDEEFQIVKTWKVDASNVKYEWMMERFFSVPAVSKDSALHKGTLEIMKGRTFIKPNVELPHMYQAIRRDLVVTILE